MKRIQKSGIFGVGLLVMATLLWPRHANAEHFDILLKVEASNSRGEAIMDTTPPIGGVNPRPVVHAKIGESIKVTWRMKNIFPHGSLKKATVHFFVARENQIGQKQVPDPAGQGGVVDNSFQMDFAPNSAANGTLKLRLTDAGNYLVRVQSEDTHLEHDHEHFAAIDLKVE